jgi:hypothetical protein
LPSARPLLVSLLLVALSPLATAQEGSDSPSHEVWTEARTVDDLFQVPANGSLTIRDAIVTLGRGIDVQAGGVLVLESTGRPTGLVAKNASGYTLRVYGGAVYANGTPESPIVFEGVSGTGQASGDTILFTTGIEVMGRFEASHARIANYSSGLKSGANATVDLRDVAFESGRGLGLVASQGLITAEGLSFRGKGAGFWSVADGKAVLRNSTFRDGNVAIMSNGNYTILENVQVRDSFGCIRNTVGRLETNGFECVDYNDTGILVTRPVKGFRLPTATLVGVRVSTSLPNASAAIHISEAPGAVLDGVDIGPVPKEGIALDGVMPASISNVTFRGTGEYAVMVIDASRDLPTERIGNGTPGTKGWLLVGYRFSARVLGVDGNPQGGAILEARHPNGTLATRKATNVAGVTPLTLLPIRTVDANGTVEEYAYNVRAYHTNSSGLWSREGYVPDGDPLLVQLLKVETNQPSKSTPGFSFLGALGAVGAVGFILRYRRNRI